MSNDQQPDAEPFSLARWSRRKHEAARPPAAPATPAPAPAPPALPAAAATAADAALPPVESLTFESDFTAFLAPKVEETVKRAALRKLFSDPRFNVMDGLDVYIDDYSKPDPIPEGMLAKLKDVYEKLAAEPAEQAAEASEEVAVAEAEPAPAIVATDAAAPATDAPQAGDS
jgi:hypothetical protein